MSDIFFFVVLEFVAFIAFAPSLLWAGLKKIADPVPLRLPLLGAAAVLLVVAALPAIIPEPAVPGPVHPEMTLVMFFLMLLLTTLAVIGPYAIFEQKIRTVRPWLSFTLLMVLGTFLLFFSTMAESRQGGPLPPFGPRLPLTGWILDGVAGLLGLGDLIYSSALPGVYVGLLAAGLFLQVFIIASVYYAMVSALPAVPEEQPGA